MQSQRFRDARQKAEPEYQIFVAKNLAVISQIYLLLDEKGWSQKKFAEELKKSDSEVSKWLSGTHNFTLQTISKIEAVLGNDILSTPKINTKNAASKETLYSQGSHRNTMKNEPSADAAYRKNSDSGHNL